MILLYSDSNKINGCFNEEYLERKLGRIKEKLY